MRIGQFEILPFVEHRFKLDGGQMFGVIPKTLWSRLVKADRNNLVAMAINLLVLKAHGKTMILDIGLGDTLTDREKRVYAPQSESKLVSGLKSLGLQPEDIDYVILSHLHTDHAGGAVKKKDGQYVPRFPNAHYIISRKEWIVATAPNERTAAVYIPERLWPLKEARQVELIDGTTELFPGVKAVHTGGHSEGHFGLEIESCNDRLCYYADIFPMTHHLNLPFVAAADVLPLETLEVKRRLIDQLVDTETILALDHDTESPLIKVRRDGRKIIAEAIDPEAK